MKRKVIQLAGKTAVISLPNKWIKNFNIKKGDELDIEEIGNTILVKQAGQGTASKKIAIKIDNFSDRTFRYVMSALHKIGYDEITLYYENNDFNDTIQDLTKNLLLGFVIIDQNNKKVVLKNVSNESESEFHPALRRAFLVILSMSNSSLEMICANNFLSLPSLINLEKSNNQLTSFCLRLINKGLYKEKEKQMFIFTLIWVLEKIADDYKIICNTLAENKDKIQEEIILIYKMVNSFFNLYYELFYKFSYEKMNDINKEKEKIIIKLNNTAPKSRYEKILLNTLWSIVSKTYDMSSFMVAVNYKEIEF